MIGHIDSFFNFGLLSFYVMDAVTVLDICYTISWFCWYKFQERRHRSECILFVVHQCNAHTEPNIRFKKVHRILLKFVGQVGRYVMVMLFWMFAMTISAPIVWHNWGAVTFSMSSDIRHREWDCTSVMSILVKLLHFSFIAMKRWKFQYHCDESDEIAKEKYVKIVGKNLEKKFDLEKSCWVPAEWRPEATQFCLFMLYVRNFLLKNHETFLNLVYEVQFWAQMEQIHEKKSLG